MECKTTNDCEGRIQISDDVVAVIAGTAAAEIEGTVSQISVLGKKNFGKGVKVTVSGNTAVIDLSLCVKFGCKIQDVSEAVQKNVKTAVETMTGLEVTEVNINVDGVAFNKKEQSANSQDEGA